MTVLYDAPHRGWTQSPHAALTLNEKYEILKDIGDGSFGSVALARVRGAGATKEVKRGTAVAIKTMKKTYESFASCLELREVIFLHSLPRHIHLVPALDVFLDPFSKKLHIAMEYMDGNLYQLMKSRDHKPMDATSVKSILYQILSGLEHIHEHNFFHRDIKPENILVSTSAPQDTGSSFRRYSALVTPPSTPPVYSIKIADFGLARETHSKVPYTTYVSTRWYRAPEVLLRAGEYSAPVDIWALGAMAVEIATLKPLFPGGNEVDQVWRVCEIMGSPGNWVNKQGTKVGGGEWREGIRLAHKLGFSFPKMAPHTMDTILPPPQWPASLASFVTWCLLWDPRSRPTSTEALQHEYFADAFDPLRPKSSGTRLLSRKQSDLGNNKDSVIELTPQNSKPASWFRRSLVARESAPAASRHVHIDQPSPATEAHTTELPAAAKPRPANTKRATWANGLPSGAPMPILPSIRPISPLPNAVTAQVAGSSRDANGKAAKKIGRQLSVASNSNHYAEAHRQEAERSLNGTGPVSPANEQKESFFSHLRKRARRLSGRNQTPVSPAADDVKANAGCAPWASYRSSMVIDPNGVNDASSSAGFAELDRALQNVKHSLEASAQASNLVSDAPQVQQRVSSNSILKRHHSVHQTQESRSNEALTNTPLANGPVSSRTRRALQQPSRPNHRYETPDEEEELLDEALSSAHNAVANLDRIVSPQKEATRPDLHQTATHPGLPAPLYPTPSQSANRNSVNFGQASFASSSTRPIAIKNTRWNNEDLDPKWPTPPYDENDWAAAAAASIFVAGDAWR